MTPGDLLNSQVEEFNKGNISFLMTLYERMRALSLRQDKSLRIQKKIRQAFQGFIDMGSKLDAILTGSFKLEAITISAAPKLCPVSTYVKELYLT